jgi:hypothetical protein
MLGHELSLRNRGAGAEVAAHCSAPRGKTQAVESAAARRQRRVSDIAVLVSGIYMLSIVSMEYLTL